MQRLNYMRTHAKINHLIHPYSKYLVRVTFFYNIMFVVKRVVWSHLYTVCDHFVYIYETYSQYNMQDEVTGD